MTEPDLRPLVQKVNAARDELEAAERISRKKRSEYHATIGALSHAGLTVREIGKAIDLSHQRVQQILDELVCSFCELTADAVPKLIAGGAKRVFICDRCVGRATLALRTKSPVEEDRLVMDFTAKTSEPCDFCGCRLGDRGDGLKKLDAMATFNRQRVCRACIKLAADILEGEWKQAKKALR